MGSDVCCISWLCRFVGKTGVGINIATCSVYSFRCTRWALRILKDLKTAQNLCVYLILCSNRCEWYVLFFLSLHIVHAKLRRNVPCTNRSLCRVCFEVSLFGPKRCFCVRAVYLSFCTRKDSCIIQKKTAVSLWLFRYRNYFEHGWISANKQVTSASLPELHQGFV